MKENNIDSLLAKVLTGTASDIERKEVERWAAESEQNLDTLESLQKVWQEQTPAPILVNSEEKINNIWEKGIGNGNSPIIVWKPFLKYAASILIVLGLVGSLYYSIPTGKEETLEETIAYTVRTNPPGQKTKLFLPDGSIVYLNGSSSIKYLQGFKGEERRVHLNGEAYFEVAKNLDKPFIVESNGVETTALGTIFNVNAYSNLEEIRVSLLEGKVKVQNAANDNVVLLPGKEVQFDMATNTFTETAFDPDMVVAWKEGKLAFRNSDFKEVRLKLERWFGVEIQVKGEMPKDWRATTVYEGQSLKNILIDLQYSKPFAYEIKEDKVIIEF